MIQSLSGTVLNIFIIFVISGSENVISGNSGASILTTLGHPEWIATSEEEYVDKAVALASDPQKLSTIRQNLRAEMEASPIMDQKGFVRELEATYQAMWCK